MLIEADDDDDTNFTARVDETSLRRCASDTQQPDDDDAFRRRDRAAAAHNRDMMVALLCNLEREEKARSKMTLFCMGSSKAKKTTFCEEDKFSWCVRSVLTRMPAIIIIITTRSTRCRCRTDRFRTWRRSSFWVSRRARRRRRRSIGPPLAFLLKVVVALLLFLCLLFEQR